MARLSVIVELGYEAPFVRLLASIEGIADEIVAVDAGAARRAVDRAREAGAQIVTAPNGGDARARDAALAAATGDYVLEVPGDASIDPALRDGIAAALSRDDPEGPTAYRAYRVRERVRVASQLLRHGSAARGTRVRLFRRDVALGTPRSAGDAVAPLLPGFVERAPRDLDALERDRARDVPAMARERYRQNARPRPWDLFAAPLAFLRGYVAWLGILDGGAGLALALADARAAAAERREIARLHREVGGARGRGRLASRARDAGRRLVVALATALFPTPRRPLPPLHALRKVLVVRADERVGNQLLTTPLLRALKEGVPHAELHLLAAARQSSVVASRHVDRLVPFEKRLAFRRPWRLVALLSRLRRERYDVVVDAGHWSAFSLTGSLLARVAAAGGAVVGHARGESPRFLSHAVTHDAANVNEVQAKLELLRPLGLAPRGLAPETALGGDRAVAEALLARAGIDGEYAVLNPGARMADRRWPAAAHAAVACGLVTRGLAVLVVWGPGEEVIARAVADEGGARLAPPTDLAELAALLRAARLCVSNNSGPMHLAVAVGTPTVGVFLGDDAARWGHLLPTFAAAEPSGEGDVQAVLAACDRVLAAAPSPYPLPRSRGGEG